MKNTEIRNELEVPLTLAVFTRSHPFLHGDTEEDLVRVPIQERVPCGHHSERERYPRFALSVANEGEKFRSRRTPYLHCAGSLVLGAPRRLSESS